jgi:plastocyanin
VTLAARRRPLATAAAAAALAVLAAGCGETRSQSSSTTTTASGSDYAPPGRPAHPPRGPTVTVTETEFKLTPTGIRVASPGTLVIRIRNAGRIPHAFAIEGPGSKAAVSPIAPGHTAELPIELQPGRYRWFCPIDRHRAKGMRGQIVVG